jgi:hypothetical protein
VATGLGSGGIEVGYWNPATGRPIGQGAFPTQAGSDFLSAIQGGGGQSSSLAKLWIQAGGSPGLANTMAAIAMAESGGDPNSVQKNQPYATTGWGLWQITPGNSVPSIGTDQQLLDPLTNAKAAVAKEKSQGLGAWTTYTSGAYKQFLGQPDTVKYGGTRPGGQPATGSSAGAGPGGVMTNYLSFRDMPRTAPPNTANPLQWFLASFTGNWDTLELPNK